MITRRCNDRQFVMHPCALVNEIVIYALAVRRQHCALARSYRETLKSWTDGRRKTVFPAGTFAMQRQFRVTVNTLLLEIG